MNIEELLKKPLGELTKEEVAYIFDNLDWKSIMDEYTKQENELQRLAENNQDNNMLHSFVFILIISSGFFIICQNLDFPELLSYTTGESLSFMAPFFYVLTNY